MIRKVMEKAIIAQATDLILQNPEWARCWAGYQRALESETFPLWYTNIIMQRIDRHPYTIYDAYCFSQIHTMLHTGALAWVELYIGREPRGDICDAENNEALQFAPDSPFRARFAGGNGSPNDGYLEWTEPIALQVTHDLDITQGIVVRPRRVSLEVGYTESNTTLEHVLSELGLARWPYGSKSIWILAAPDDEDINWGAQPDPEPVVQLTMWPID